MSPPVPEAVLRVASVPGAHPYVAHLRLDRAGIELLADPRPPGAPPGRWWPPVMLDAGWITRHAASFDVLHVHFGAESLSIAALSGALAALADTGRPLVYTVHDLENPQLVDQRHHADQLDLLITRAAEIVTLTSGAAAEIARRWGRASTVIPHPRMLAAGQVLPAPTARTPALRIGVHLRDLRPGIDGDGVARGLAGALARLRADGIEAAGQISLFDATRDEDQAARVRAAAAGSDQLSLVEAPRASEAALVADLSGLDVSLLPYRHGTHSGWAELCWDLGLPVAGPEVGYVAEQHGDPGWFLACDPTDPASLARVLGHLALAARPGSTPGSGAARRALIDARRRERDRLEPRLGQAHRAVYRRACDPGGQAGLSPIAIG
jgi:hypothetical protein